MSKTPCKGIKKDGSPCQGNGLDQFDGLCIAHGPAPDQAHEWRSLGGKNSATAARLDKRIPERLKQAIDLVHDSMNRVAEGTLSPAVCNAICRSAKTLVDLHRRADEEMKVIHTEETQAAAAEFVGAHANLEVLEAADAIVAKQNQYRAESLVDQGFATFVEPSDPKEAPEVVLNGKGRRRYGYQTRPEFLQLLFHAKKDEVRQFAYKQWELPGVLLFLEEFRDATESALARVKGDPAAMPDSPPPLDPLTGQALHQLPPPAKGSSRSAHYVHTEELSEDFLEEQQRQIKEMTEEVIGLMEDEDYNQNRNKFHPTAAHEELAAFLEAQKDPNGKPLKHVNWQ